MPKFAFHSKAGQIGRQPAEKSFCTQELASPEVMDLSGGPLLGDAPSSLIRLNTSIKKTALARGFSTWHFGEAKTLGWSHLFFRIKCGHGKMPPF